VPGFGFGSGFDKCMDDKCLVLVFRLVASIATARFIYCQEMATQRLIIDMRKEEHG
jgi:hypothetical protein